MRIAPEASPAPPRRNRREMTHADIVLVQPRASAEPAYPISLALMIPALRERGLAVQGADLSFDTAGDVVDLVAGAGTRWVGATVLPHTATAVSRLFARVNERAPAVRSFVLGHLPALDPSEALARTGADVAVVGEPGPTVADLAAGADPPESMAGCALRSDHGLRQTPRQPVPFDDLPLPDRSVFPVLRYSQAMRSTALPYAAINTSRGCPAACGFCPVPAVRPTGFDARSPEGVYEELARLVGDHGVRSAHVEDDAFLSDPGRISALCALLREHPLPLVLELVNGVRPEHVEPGMLEELASAGCRRIVFGFEHLGRPVDGVGTSPKRATALVREARRAGMRTGGYFIVGLPGVGVHGAARSVGHALGLGLDDANFVPFYPAPGAVWSTRAGRMPEPMSRLFARAAQLLFFGHPRAVSRMMRDLVGSPGTAPALARKAVELVARGGPVPTRDGP